MMNIDFLERVELFKDLDDIQLERILGCGKIVEFKRGEQLFAAEQDADFLWVVTDGQVELREDDVDGHDSPVISTLSETMAFGWSSLVPPYKYYFSAYCAGRTCKVLKMEKSCLIQSMEGDTDMGCLVMSRLLMVVGQRFDQLEEEVIKRLGQDIINQW